MKKILIVHLAYNGDCLMATTLARQIKQDHPGCHLTWAIGYKYKQVIENNPYVDQIWEIFYDKDESPLGELWYRVEKEAEERKKAGEFDEVIYSQIFPGNVHLYDGTTRSSIFRAYPGPITVPVTPIIRLRSEEVENVIRFARQHELNRYKHVILCECSPNSGQSFLTPGLMIEVGNKITAINKDVIFIISTHLKLDTKNDRIIDASILTYRENAELSKYSTLLVGCSSGITWLLTSDWAKQIPTVQFLNNPKKPNTFGGVIHDFMYWGLSTEHIIESTQQSADQIASIIQESLENFADAKQRFGEQLYPTRALLRSQLQNFSLIKFRQSLRNSLLMIRYFSERNKDNVKISRLMPLYIIWIILKNMVVKICRILLKRN